MAQTPPAFPTLPPDTNTTNTAQQDSAARALRNSIVDDAAAAPQVVPPTLPPATPAPTNSFSRRRFGGRGNAAAAAVGAASDTNSPAGPAGPNGPVAGNRIVNPGGANGRVPGVPGGLPNPAAGTNSTAGGTDEKIIPPGQINFPEIELNTVLDVYAELVGRTVLHAALPAVKISLKTQTALTKSEAIQAFDSVFAMNGVTLVNVGDKFVKAVPSATSGTVPAPFDTNKWENLPEADQYITHIVQLKYIKPSEIQPALQPLAQIPTSIVPIESNNMLIIRDYAGNVKRMMELIAKLDVNLPMDYESEVIPIKYAQAQDIASALSSLGGGTGTSIGSRPGGGGSRAGGVGMGGQGMSGGLGTSTLGSSGFGGSGVGGYGQQGTLGGLGGATGGMNTGTLGGSTGAGGRTSSFGDRLNSLVRKAAGAGDFQVLGNTKIIADQRTNSLLVFANKQDMEMVKKIIAQLDIVLPQVLIEAMIMEVSLDSSHSLGMSYIQNTPSTLGNSIGAGGINNGTLLTPSTFTSAGTNAIPSGFSYAANFGGDFTATAVAIANDSHINVLSRPRIQTSHGVPASIQVGQQVPIVSGTYFGGYTGSASSQYQEQFVGITLQVTPLINPDGLVVMDIVQNVQQLGPNYTIDGNPVPSTTQRSTQSTVSVRDRDTIIVGGMISSTKNVSNAGVPLLKDIPGLGWLFRTSSSDNQRDELIVLVRPTVLPTPEAAALAASRERDRLPSVRQAEDEEHQDELKRLKQYEKRHPSETQP